MAPEGDERTGDVSNVVFSNGWIHDTTIKYLFIMLLLIQGCMLLFPALNC